MVRSGHCIRPGCGEPADAVLTYDYASSTVWLDDLGEVVGGAWPLCGHHADGIKMPIGWSCEDRRGRTVITLPSHLASWSA